MIAPVGMAWPSVTGGGDWRTLLLREAAIPFRLSGAPSVIETTDGVRRCLFRYEAERGRAGRGEDCWIDERRLTSGDTEVDEAGDRFEGGV